MSEGILTLLGGVGLFLFGIQTLTDGLRRLAGARAREALARLTRTPLRGVITGAVATATIQSSSATTVIAIGLVGAGLISFAQAVGVILGANIGTTLTGWIVVIVGFKLKLGLAALPMVFAGALLRLLARGRLADAATATVGFGMLFLGLELMQAGLSGFEGRLTPDRFPPDGWLGRAALVGIGLAISLVVRSSSAGVATALVLLGAGAISLPQAAAMIIGMDVGTTFTGLLATVGGSRAMRRTGVAHLLFNLLTAVLAFGLLGPATALALQAAGGDAQTALVMFHTGFNVLGVALVLPVAAAFTRLVERLVPDRAEAMAAALSPSLLDDPGAALDAAATTAHRIADALFAGLAETLRPGGAPGASAEAAAAVAGPIEALDGWLGRLSVPEDGAAPLLRYSALVHQLDHLRRLSHRAAQTDRAAAVLAEPRLARFTAVLRASLARAAAGEPPARGQARLDRLGRAIARHEARLRRDLAVRADLRGMPPARLYVLTDGIRWLRRTVGHAERILHYRTIAEGAPAPPPGR